ncbi:MAG: sigE 1 [Akkermansiaceae bacterium]|nr:sigE 1 [Akkermansiaceae bacterium]
MISADDQNLLQRLRSERSEQAFRELVARYSGQVYGTALRSAGGRARLAEEIAQAVFVEFARKAARLPAGTALGGWLHRCARFKAIEALRAEGRRRRYEMAAAGFLAESDGGDGTAWLDLTPVLDEELDRLPESARLPLILRFYERRSLKEIGGVLGISEDAAQKRIQRALEALRGSLAKRGITSSASSLAPVLFQAFPAQAPPGLAAAISTGAWQAGIAGSLLSSSSLLPLIFAMNVKTVTLVAVAIVVVAAPLAYQQRTISGQAAKIAALERRGFADSPGSGPAVAAARPARATGAKEGRSAIQALARALDEPDPVVRMERFSRLLGDLRAEDAGALAEMLDGKKKDGVPLDEEEQLLLHAWGGLDGPAAIAYLREKGREHSEAAAAVMSSWATRDLASALDWLKAQPNGGSDALAAGIAYGWGTQDLDAAAKWVEERPATDMRAGMEGVLFDRYLETRGMEAVKQWYAQMPEGTFRQHAADRIAAEISKEQPVAALDWLVQHGEGPGPSHAMATDVIMGTLAEKDLPAAEAWLQRNGSAAEYDDAAEALVHYLRQSDPAAAAKWARTIRDAARREVAVKGP